ncbi:GNAT family N-acetyltransferase [Paenibacillus sp. strain BS8-2]
MIIRVLLESDAQLYQELRLRALLTNPEAFGSTYERESTFSMAFVMDRIKPNKDKFILGALDDHGFLAGTVALIRDNGIKSQHKANIYGMYVSEEYREQGIGQSLMKELIRMVRGMDELEQLKLSVVTTNDQAKRLYQSVGFETYGLERNALKYNGQYYDEELMVLQL